MRDNTKGGALTEVTFFILLSLYTPKHGYAIMQFIWSLEYITGKRLDCSLWSVRWTKKRIPDHRRRESGYQNRITTASFSGKYGRKDNWWRV